MEEASSKAVAVWSGSMLKVFCRCRAGAVRGAGIFRLVAV